MRVGWYPASFHRPKTAFTFDILDSYQKLSLQGKLNLYDYYWFILQKTDNCGQKRAIVSQVFSHIWVLLLIFFAIAPVSRDVALRSPMEELETDYKGRRWSRCSRIGFCS